MKLIGVLVCVGLICAASAKLPMANPRNEPPPSINDHFVRFLHNERVNFPCGWPDSDIAPIEPHYVAEYDMLVTSGTEFSSIDFRMRDANVTRLMHMCLEDFNLSVISLIMRFNAHFDRLNIDGLHTTHANMINGVVTVPISGSGTVNMDVNDVRVSVTAQLATGEGGLLSMTNMHSVVVVNTVDARLTGFGLMDGTISRMISSAAPGMVNDSQDQINQGVRDILMPALNRFLNQHTMVTLVNLMADRNQNPGPRRCFHDTPRECPA